MGQFRKGASGNPAGRRPGARNRATLAVEALLDGEAEKLSRIDEMLRQVARTGGRIHDPRGDEPIPSGRLWRPRERPTA